MSKIFLSLVSLTFTFLFYLLVTGPSYAAASGPTSPYSLQAMPGTKPGTVDLSWVDDGTANQYDITYGTDSSAKMWGVQDIKESMNQNQTFTVTGLQPGTKYYFSLVAENSGSFYLQAGPLSTISK